MRRVALLAIVILIAAPACVSPRLVFPDIPLIGPIGIGGQARVPPQPQPQPVPCAEISRIPCDLVHCDGPGYDFVTVKCAGKAATGRCVQNGGCPIDKDDE